MEVPYGYCRCTCGNKTPIAKYNSVERGYIKGEPTPYCLGHSANGKPRDPIAQPVDTAIRHVPLSQGMYAIVSAGRYDDVMRSRWYATYDPKMGSYYASRRRKPSDPAGPERISMHVFLHPVPEGFVVDHKNKNTLDNRDENLRQATPEENGRNQRVRRNNTTGITGVSTYWVHGKNYGYTVRIMHEGKRITVGHCKTLEAAAKMRREAEIKYYGKFKPD